jgi:F420-dependent oxidoreductase-like protein
MKAHFGVNLPQINRTWDETRDAALEFERLGYDSLWLNDHLYGVPRPEIPILECWTALTAVGAITRRVQLGTLVSPPAFRNPALLAKVAATLDQITKGRVILGLGTGWFQREFEGYGFEFLPPQRRVEQLAEAAELTLRVWTEPEATYAGKHFRSDRLILAPRPYQEPHPPLLIGGAGEKAVLRIAARYADIWNNPAAQQTQLPHKIEVLRRHCEQVGRDPAAVRISQQCLVVLAPDEAQAGPMLERATKLFGGHLGDVNGPLVIAGSPDRVAERIQQHIDLGCDFFMIEFFGRDTREPARLFAETVMPRFR